MKFISAPLFLLASLPVSLAFFPSIPSDTSAAPGMRVNRIMLFRAFPFEVRPGDPITLDGSGFSRTLNKIYFNDNHLVTATSSSGAILKITAPAGLAEGEYRLSVSNKLGSSDNPQIKIAIKVTNSPQPPPTIEKASKVGDLVTVTGTGFTSSNQLLTTLGNSSGSVSSPNGSTLTFSITDLSFYNKVKQSTKGRKYQMSLWIYVQNEHGINKNPYKLEIII